MSQTDEDQYEELPTDSEYEYGEGEEEEEEEENPEIWSTYDSNTFISGPYQSEESTIPENILEYQYPLTFTPLIIIIITRYD